MFRNLRKPELRSRFRTTTITSAQTCSRRSVPVPASGRGGAGRRSQCRFQRAARVLPRCGHHQADAADSDIKMEIWLPASGWNGKLEANGNGGWTGSIAPATLAAGLQRGYAAAMTDTGTRRRQRQFRDGSSGEADRLGISRRSRDDREVESDHRGVLWRRAEALVLEWLLGGWHGRPSRKRRSYPEDFNGIVAGSPGMNWTGRSCAGGMDRASEPQR